MPRPLQAVRLDPMTAAEFDVWLAAAIPSYAADKVDSGQWPAEEAVARSERAHHELLGQGVATPGHCLYTVRDARSGQAVGMLWVQFEAGPGMRDAYLFQFQVDQELRGRGYGTAALRSLMQDLAAAGVRALGLHVFAGNVRAQRLYERLGFQTTGLNMIRPLQDRTGPVQKG